MYHFQIKSLDEAEFPDFFTMDDKALEKIGAVKMIADKTPGFPCRVSLEDAAIGEELVLLSYQHHKTASPYQASGPVFIRKNARTALLKVDEIPFMLEHRLLSLRAYNKNGMMKTALVSEGSRLKEALQNLFEDREVDYIHIHNARPGCYNCRVERA